MKLNKLKEMAGDILGKSRHRLVVDREMYLKNKDVVDKAITREDVKAVIKAGIIKKIADTGHSRGRARVLLEKKKLKRKRGPGQRKGTPSARQKSNEYNQKVRGVRKRLRELKKEGKLNDHNYAKLYLMIKGNYFRGKKHLEEYISGENK